MKMVKLKYDTYLVEDVIEYDSEYITKDRDYVSIPKDIKINQISGTNNLIAIKGFDYILTEEEFKTLKKETSDKLNKYKRIDGLNKS